MSPGAGRRPLAGARLLVTGASSGVGAAVAEAAARDGARVALAARSIEALTAVAERCRSHGAEAIAIPADVTRAADCEALVAHAVEHLGGIDMLVCCAGLGMWARFGDLADDGVLQAVMDVNYWGVVRPTLHALPHLRDSRGMLVVVSSVQGRVGVPYHSGYAAAKHAVQGFCDTLRMEEREQGVAVLTVLAHWIRGTALRQRALGPDGRPRGASAPAHGGDAVAVDSVAGRILDAACRRRRQLHIPGYMRMLDLLAAVAPAAADRLISSRVAREHRS